MSVRVGEAADAPDFPTAAKKLIADTQLRHNVRHATDVIRGKRAKVVGEMPDWEELREAGYQIKEHTLRHLDSYLNSSRKLSPALADMFTGRVMPTKPARSLLDLFRPTTRRRSSRLRR